MKIKAGNIGFAFTDGMSTWKQRILHMKNHDGVTLSADQIKRHEKTDISVLIRQDSIKSELIRELF